MSPNIQKEIANAGFVLSLSSVLNTNDFQRSMVSGFFPPQSFENVFSDPGKFNPSEFLSEDMLHSGHFDEKRFL